MPDSEATRLARKTAMKFAIRRVVGELYVGKRLKMRSLSTLLRELPLPPSPRVLEVGCEDGVFSEWFSRKIKGATVVGLEIDVDQSAACRAWAQRSGRGDRLMFRQGDVLDLADREAYDVVFCLDVLGYIRDDKAAIARMAAALKRGGWLVVHQPNTTYQRFDRTLHYVSPEEAGKITAGHLRHGYAPDELAALIRTDPTLWIDRLLLWNGRASDIAHRVYTALERPAFLRPLSLPLVDALSILDRRRPPAHGNTVCVVARRASTDGRA